MATVRDVDKRQRELKRIIEGLGGRVVAWRLLGSGHYRIEYQIGDRRLSTVAPYSPSDHRALKNFKAQVRRRIKAEGSEDARR